MSNRNQHFVPQVYLRRFGAESRSGQQKLINLYAISSGRAVPNASIRHQASQNYFYGDVKVFEDLIQHFEGRYGLAMRHLEADQLGEDDVATFMQFMFLQHLRTPFQLQERLRIIEQWGELEIAGKRVRDSLPPPDKVEEIQQHLAIFASEHAAFSDLEPRLLINKTNLPFISSDNPSILMNRLYSQRYGDDTAGAVQSGAATCLPLTPRICLFAYDRDVYQSLGSDRTLEIRNRNDVNRLNELQVIRASEVLFFHDWSHQEYVERLFRECAPRRRDEWTVSWSGIRDGQEGEFERFRRVKPEDKDSLEPRIQSISPILPAPSMWPSFLKFKMRPTGCSNGSAVGFIRIAHSQKRRLSEMSLPAKLPPNSVAATREAIYQLKRADRAATSS